MIITMDFIACLELLESLKLRHSAFTGALIVSKTNRNKLVIPTFKTAKAIYINNTRSKY